MGELSWGYARILTAILTYDGAKLSKINDYLEDIPDNDKPDLYLDLSKSIILKNEATFDPIKGIESPYFVIENASLGLARFLTILATITGLVQTREVKWREYIG